MTDSLRELDCQIAEHVLGYEVRTVKPDWYPHEVRCFFWRESNLPLMAYSYDQNACNASMYANGIDMKDGYAQALPRWSGDSDGMVWEVVHAMIKRGFRFWLVDEPGICENRFRCCFAKDVGRMMEESTTAKGVEEAICRAALKTIQRDGHDAG